MIKKFNVLLILFFVLVSISIASVGSKLKKSNPNLYQEAVGDIHILNEKNFEKTTIITLDYKGKVKEKSDSKYLLVDIDKPTLLYPKWTTINDIIHVGKVSITGKIKKYKQGKYYTIEFNQDKKNYKGKYAKYLSDLKVLKIAHQKLSNYYLYTKEKNVIHSVISKIKIFKKEVLKKAELNKRLRFLSRLPRSYNKGRLGGGYQNIKWGSSKEQVKIKLKKFKIKYDFTNRIVFTVKGEGTITCRFYKNYFYQVEFDYYDITFMSYSYVGLKYFKSLKIKYGNPRLLSSREEGYSARGTYMTSIVKSYKWDDGNTKIESQTCEPESKTLARNGKFDTTIYYRSIHLSKLIKKIEDKKNHEKNEDIL